MYAAKHDAVRLRLLRDFCKIKGISHVIGQFLHLVRNVIMRQNDGISALFERFYALFCRMHTNNLPRMRFFP